MNDWIRGARYVVTIAAALLKRYKENLNAYCGKLREFCVRRGMIHVTVDTNTEMDALLLDYLRKRGLLKLNSPATPAWTATSVNVPSPLLR